MSELFRLSVGQGIQAQSGVWYKNVQVLGHGGNAITFLALATSGANKGVLFAIKVFRMITNESRRDAFIREIEFLEKASHPSVMRVYDAGIFIRHSAQGDLQYPFVAAEYLPKTLFDVIRGNQASIAEKLSYALQLLSALNYLSSANPAVIHRDIKPQNIFVKGGSCVLGDFGLMKFVDTPDDDDREILKESELPGMPFYYRTPDLISYAKKESGITTKSDVFQLGLVLTELFTGWNPARRPAYILEPLALEPIGTVGGALSGGIVALLNRMLTMDPDARPSASQLMDSWQGVLDDAINRAHALQGRVF